MKQEKKVGKKVHKKSGSLTQNVKAEHVKSEEAKVDKKMFYEVNDEEMADTLMDENLPQNKPAKKPKGNFEGREYKSEDQRENRSKSETSKYSSMNKKNEPLIINDALDEDEDDTPSVPPVVNSKSEEQNKERMIEEYNSGTTTQKYFVPKRDIVNRTDPNEISKFSKPDSDNILKNINLSKGINQTQKFIVKKMDEKIRSANSSKEGGKITVVPKPNKNSTNHDDSQNTSQKDVIVRRIKKKSENGKVSSQATLGFGHKKSNSEMIPDTLPKKESFQDFKKYQNSVNLDHNSSIKRQQKITKEFRSYHYKKALDKFEEFKKEQQMIRKNTPITKFRKSSAKKRKPESNKMHKPKSMGMMNTQPLNNYKDYSNSMNYNNMMIPDRNSAMSLQIGNGNYAQYANKRKARLGQKMKNLNNMENMNIRYTKYHQIYTNKTATGGPIKAIQKKNEKFTTNRIATNDDGSRGRSSSKRQGSSKRKPVSSHAKRPISPNMNTFYGKIGAIDPTAMISKGIYGNKFISATNGFEMFHNAEKVYTNGQQPVKATHAKRPTSNKKQARIRLA